MQQGGHLVDESAGAAGTAAVHAHLGAVCQKEDLGVLAAQLDDDVGGRRQALGRHTGGEHLLHERHAAPLCKAHAGRARDGQLCAGDAVFRQLLQQLGGFFGDVTVVTLVAGMHQLAVVVQHGAFDGGGTDVKADPQAKNPFPPYLFHIVE